MSNSTLPDADVPIFEGRAPWLALPAVAIFAICVAYRPKKAIFAPEGSKVAKNMHQTKWFLLGLQLFNVACTFGIYFIHDGPPLTLGLPVSAVLANDDSGARFVEIAVLTSVGLAFYAQMGMAAMYVYVSGRHAKAGIVLAVVAISSICAPIWVSCWLIAFMEGYWPDRLVIQEIRWMMKGQFFTVFGDTVMSIAFFFLHRQAEADSKTLTYKLDRIASLTHSGTVALMGLGFFPKYGLLSNTLDIAGCLIPSQLHLISAFFMWRAAQQHPLYAQAIDLTPEDDEALGKVALVVGAV